MKLQDLLDDDGIDFHPGKLEQIPEEGPTFISPEDLTMNSGGGGGKAKTSRVNRLQNRIKGKDRQRDTNDSRASE